LRKLHIIFEFRMQELYMLR